MTPSRWSIIPTIEIVVELIGGYEPARELVLRAIANGKHVVTANKALIAKHGNEIFAAAQEQGVMVAFEAAVAGGIPIIKAIREGLAANRIEWMAGIINGTGNFILTEMRDKGRDFADVLEEAQRAGLCRGRSDLRCRGHRRRAQAHHPGLDRLRHPAAVRQGLYRGHQPDHRARMSAMPSELGYRIKHLGIARRTAAGHRAARAPDADSRNAA